MTPFKPLINERFKKFNYENVVDDKSIDEKNWLIFLSYDINFHFHIINSHFSMKNLHINGNSSILVN